MLRSIAEVEEGCTPEKCPGGGVGVSPISSIVYDLKKSTLSSRNSAEQERGRRCNPDKTHCSVRGNGEG
ncbi:hypothetical protein KM043_001280 [Ampulex compressa]|nr:hypothetical protein KM043_001280 [Ampulex compressa]